MRGKQSNSVSNPGYESIESRVGMCQIRGKREMHILLGYLIDKACRSEISAFNAATVAYCVLTSVRVMNKEVMLRMVA